MADATTITELGACRIQSTLPGGIDTLLRICSQLPTPIRDLRPEVPPEVEALVNRLLEKSPDQRPGDG